MNPILARFQDAPALIDASKGAWFQSCADMAASHLAELDKSAATDNFWFDADDWRSQVRPYNVKNGILYVPVRGLLLNNFPWQLWGYATGYEYIREAIRRGVDDREVKGIVLVIESGGGMVAGNWDLVDFISGSRDAKPIRAVAAEYAYSAAYNIAAATSHITVARTGGVGSIGVIVTHFEYSRMLEEAGITVNFIRSKDDKAEGNPYEALSEGARQRIKADVDELHEQFVAMVATNRSMEAAAVDATDAHTFMGRNAIEAGLADAIGNLDDAITAFEATFLPEGEDPMADVSQADHEAAVAAARTDGHTAGVAEGRAAGAAEAAERINTIIGSEAGQKRPKAALNAALKTSMSADEAVAFLDTLDEEKKAENKPAGAGAPKGMLKAAMDAEGGAGINALETEDDDEVHDDADAKSRSKVEQALAFTKGQKSARS